MQPCRGIAWQGSSSRCSAARELRNLALRKTDSQNEHQTIDPQCLENHCPEGPEPTLRESVGSPFQAEPRRCPPARRSRYNRLEPASDCSVRWLIKRYKTLNIDSSCI